MRPPSLRGTQPWLIGLSLAASLGCIGLAVFLGLIARTDATDRAGARMAAQADRLARQIDADLAVFDLTLHEVAARTRGPAPAQTQPKIELLALPLTSEYVEFINVLNEVGDVIADPRSNVSRPVNFAGRDYFQNHLKNAADIMMIGRPFGTAPNQHAAIPISRRLTTPDGAFAGVVVAGVRLSWLSDLLSRTGQGMTVRLDDGLILMRSPFDAEAIGRVSSADPAWQEFLRTGRPLVDDDGGLRLFRRVGVSSLVLEFARTRAEIEADQPFRLAWLLPLVLVPGLCVAGLSLLARQLRDHSRRIEAAATAFSDERMHVMATMSHELRTPLTALLAHAELLCMEGNLNERQTYRLAQLSAAGDMMRTVVNRVTDVTHPEDRDAPPVMVPCDLDGLIRTCTGMVETAASGKGLRLSATIDPAAPVRSVLARDLLQQVLINLLTNAVKFTARGSVHLQVKWNPAGPRFEVVDTGAGVPGSKRARLFRAYDRLDMPTHRANGTGLGLSITERCVRRMGGRIGHEPNPGGGSTFWVELPPCESASPNPPLAEPVSRPRVASPPIGGNRPARYATGEPDDIGRNDDVVSPSGVAAAIRRPASTPTTGPLRVLLVDDMEMTRSVASEYLRSAGHVVTEVPDGAAALEAVCTSDFDVILTDMRMPTMDGLEATRRIRALRGKRSRIPVVLVTADLMALSRVQSGQSGADLGLRKPFTQAELLNIVATAAGLSAEPRKDADDRRVLDDAVFADLAGRLCAKTLATYVETATRRIEELLILLERPDAADSADVEDAVHDLVGVAGLLGLIELSSRLRRFDIATNRAAPVAVLREAAVAALRALRRQRNLAAQ